MNLILIAIAAGFGYLYLKRSQVAQTGTAIAVPRATAVAATNKVGPSGFANYELNNIQQGLNAVPVVGPILSQVFGEIKNSLFAASAKRAKEAQDENSALRIGVPGVDDGIAQVATAYNNGSLNGDQAIQLINQVRQNYWDEMTPHIQPGRNGCASGAADYATLAVGGKFNWCGGSWGAACCVGYADLEPGIYDLRIAINNAEKNSGQSFSAKFPTVNASKYGGVNRPGYTITVTKPSSGFASVLSPIDAFLKAAGL